MQNAINIINDCELEIKDVFSHIDEVVLYNQEKVLTAFKKNMIAARHFAPTTGYGYDDVGRDTLCALFADIFNAESAIVSPHLINGTHAIFTALAGVLRPNDTMLSITDEPYDTLLDAIKSDSIGSLKDFGINFDKIALKNGEIDYIEVEKYFQNKSPKLIFIQRSRGYNWRNALSISDISKTIKIVKKLSENAIIMIDNCYGEFVDKLEPTDVGADLVAGSLIKNPGGGIAQTGGYIIGRKDLIDLVAGRLTVPGIGMEAGSYQASYLPFFQGLFIAPHVVAQAMKTSALFASVFSRLGYSTFPEPNTIGHDIITSIKFNTKDELLAFCCEIQNSSPVDSFATPEPWDMPGYAHQVIMAAGAFVQGSSIELSADSPIVEPYIAYCQGSLTYEHGKIALKNILNKII